MYLYLLFIIILVLLICSLLYTNFDFISPCNIFLETYFIACFFAILNIDKWSFEMHANTFGILLGGLIIFICVSYIMQPKLDNKVSNITEIVIKRKRVNAIIIFDIVLIILIYLTIYRVASSEASIFDFPNTISNYRNYSVRNPMYSLPSYIVYGSKISEVCCYIFIFAFFNNVAANKKNTYFFIPIILELIRNFETGARMGMVNIVIAIAVAAFVFLYKRNNLNSKVRIALKYIFISILLFFLFYYIAKILGRSFNLSIMDYLSIYIGAPLKLLDMYLQDPHTLNNMWGEETFYFANRFLGKYGLVNISYDYSVHLEFRYINGHRLGNVYTAYRRWINDFGIVGFILGQIGFSIFHNWLYKKISNLQEKNGRLAVLYLFFSNTLFLHFFDDRLYRNVFCTAFVIYILLIHFLYMYLVENRIKIVY